MIRLCLYKRKDKILGFGMKGHANTAPRGRDIVCAGVSALAINTVNSCEILAKLMPSQFFTEEKEVFFFGYNPKKITAVQEDKLQLLLNSFVLGVQSIQDSYSVIQFSTREV